MADAIAVVNAGSSSLKFSLFIERAGSLEGDLRGQVEGLFTDPKFVAKGADGAVLAQKAWGEGTRLGHAGALGHLFGVLRERHSRNRPSTTSGRLSTWPMVSQPKAS